MIARQRQLEQGERTTIGTPQGEASVMGRRDLPDDAEPMTAPSGSGKAGDHLGGCVTTGGGACGAAGIGDDDPHATLVWTGADGDLRTAMFEH